MNSIPDFVPFDATATQKAFTVQPNEGKAMAGRLVKFLGNKPSQLADALVEMLSSGISPNLKAGCLQHLSKEQIDALKTKVHLAKTEANTKELSTIFDAAIQVAGKNEIKEALQGVKAAFGHAVSLPNRPFAAIQRYTGVAIAREIQTQSQSAEKAAEHIVGMLLSQKELIFKAGSLRWFSPNEITALQDKLVKNKTEENTAPIVQILDAAIATCEAQDTQAALQQLRGAFLLAKPQSHRLAELFQRLEAVIEKPLSKANLNSLYTTPENQQKSWFSATASKKPGEFALQSYSVHGFGPMSWWSTTELTVTFDRLGQVRLVDEQNNQQIFANLADFEANFLAKMDSVGKVLDRFEKDKAQKLAALQKQAAAEPAAATVKPVFTPKAAAAPKAATPTASAAPQAAAAATMPAAPVRQATKSAPLSIRPPAGMRPYAVQNMTHAEGRRAAQVYYYFNDISKAPPSKEAAREHLAYIFNTTDTAEIIKREKAFLDPKLTLKDRGLGAKMLKSPSKLGIPPQRYSTLTWESISAFTNKLLQTANFKQ